MVSDTLLYGKYYHVYNRGVNSIDLFKEKGDYERFLSLYTTYVDPIADTFAWCLMGNHFHMLVKVKEHIVYTFSKDDKSISSTEFESRKWETTIRTEGNDSNKTPNPTKHFAHLFNAYAQYFNLKTGRSGILFDKSYKYIEIDTESYFTNVFVYIHNNPVHHGFCESPDEYAWSSYNSFFDNNSICKSDEFSFHFRNKKTFALLHKQTRYDYNSIETLIY